MWVESHRTGDLLANMNIIVHGCWDSIVVSFAIYLFVNCRIKRGL